MAFSTVGIRLIAEGLGPFTANLTAARRQISFISSRGIKPLTTSTASASTAMSGFTSAINAPSRAITTFGNSITRVGANVRRFGNEMTALGFRMGFVSAGFLGVAVASGKAAAQFETSIARIATLTDVGVAGARQFGQAILDIADDVGQLPSDLADAGYFITSTGITNIQTATDILLSAAKASSIGLGEVDEVARVLTATISAYGESVITPAQATDQLFEAVKRGGVEAEGFATSLAKVLPLASEMGVSFAEATAFITTFTVGGATASQAATALQRTLLAIEKPTAGASDAFAKLGFVVNDTTNEFRDLVEEQGLAVALGTIRQRAEEAGVELAQVFGRVTALTGTLFVTSEAQLGRYLETLAAIKNSAGTAEAAFQVVTQTTEFQFNQLRATLQATAIQIGSVLLPAINQIIGRIAPLIATIGQLAAQNPRLVLLATGFALVATAASGLLIIGGFLASAIGSVIAAVGALITGFGALLSPIGLVIVAVGTLVGLLTLGFAEVENRNAQMVRNMNSNFSELDRYLSQTSASTSQRVADNFGEMQDKMQQRAARTAQAAKDWGGNIVVQFARGMAQAAVAVVNVLIQIGQTIRSWLAPGSPPRLLPDLPAWGASAMSEFMGGWLKGDFSVFDDIASITESFFRSLGDGIGDESLIPTILGSRSAIADAIEQMRTVGSVSQATLAAISGGFGATSQDIQRYVQLMLQLKQANDAVAAAQAEVDRITRQYAETLRPIDSELQDITDRRDEISMQLREQELRDILAQPNLDPLAEELALMELREIELKRQKNAVEDQRDTELDAANERLTAAELAAQQIQDQVDAQKALIQFQIQNNELLNEQADIMDRLNDSIKAAAGSIGDAAEALGEFGDFAAPGGFADAFDLGEVPEGGLLGDVGADIEREVNKIKDDITGLFTAITDEFKPVQKAFNDLKNVWGDIFELVASNKGNIGGIAQEVLAWAAAFILFKTVMKGFAIVGTIQGLVTAISGAGGLTAAIGGVVAALGGPFILVAAAAIAIMGFLLAKFGGFTGVADQLRAQFTGGGTFDPQNGIIATSIRMVYGEGGIVDTALTNAWNSFERWGTNVGQSIQTWADSTRNKFITWKTDTATTIQTWSDDLILKIQTWADSVRTQFEQWKTDIITKAGEMAQGVLDKVAEFATSWFDAGADIVQGFIDGIGGMFNALIRTVTNLAQGARDAWNDFWGISSPSQLAFEASGDVMQGFINGVNAMAPALQSALVSATTPAVPVASQPTAYMPPGAVTDNRVGAQFTGDVNINNGMDMSMLEAVIRRTVNNII